MRTTASSLQKNVYQKFPVDARRSALVALIVFVLAGVAASAKADSLDGVWNSHFGKFILKRNGDQVTGTHVDTSGGSWEIRGTMAKNPSGRTRFYWNEFGGGAIVVYDAIVHGDTMDLYIHNRGSNGVEANLEDTAHRVSH